MGVYAYPAAGSYFGTWTINKGEDYYGVENGEFCNDPAYKAEGVSEFGGPYCVLNNKANPAEGDEITVLFCLEGESLEECEGGGEPNLILNIEGGSGTIISNPAGLECTGSAPKTCEASLPSGKVTLTASPAPGFLLKSWKKCEVVNGRQCTVTVDETEPPTVVGITFIPAFELKGSKSGGLGIMGTAPGGINCGYACTSSTALYKEGALTVKAKPAKHFHFVKFQNGTGSAASCNGVTALECVIGTFNSNSALEEVYAEDAKNTLTLTKEGGGQGFVKTKPTNINCGYTCTAAKAEFYASETAVEVTVALNKGTTKVNWTTGSGTCTGNALTCTVNMSASHTLVAKFE